MLWKNKQDHIVFWLCGLISMCFCLFVLLIRGMWVKCREIIGETLFLLSVSAALLLLHSTAVMFLMVPMG